jgi:predicted transposase YbfD/YdcC
MKHPLSAHLSEITDFRRQNKNFAHPLLDILLLSICATFNGAEDFHEIEDFGKEKESFLRTFLELPHGIPSHDTIRRVFQYIDNDVFNAKFRAWMQALLDSLNLTYQHISIDGKTLRGAKTGLHLVHAFASELGVCLAQVKTDEKSNEITAIPNLLDTLYLKGCIVSLDAMGTQKEIAEKIVAKEGDYFLALKGNQKTLFEQVKQQFAIEQAESSFKITDFSGSHRAVTAYEVGVCYQLKWIENASEWVNLQSVVCVKSKSNKRQEEVRYYISSVANLQAEQAYKLSPQHWSVENQLHWHLDVTLKEDSKRNRKDESAQNLSLLRKILLNVAQIKEPKLSKKRIIKKMMWNQEYFLQMLSEIINT